MTTHARTTASRPILRLANLLGAILLASAFMVVGTSSTPAVAAPIIQCNGVFNGGDQGANCQITVENFLDLGTGEVSSRVTTLQCNGGAYTVNTCTGTPLVQTFDYLTDVVEQCNFSDEGGGSTLQCSVVMINIITGEGTPSDATVNQCNRSFDSLLLPEDSSCLPGGATTDATITQCNDSLNGGTQESMNCIVTGLTISSAMPVRVNQCNNSANGGGSLLECSTSITTSFVPAGEDTPSGGGATPTAPEELAETGAGDVPLAIGGAALIVVLGAILALRARRPSPA